MDKGDLFKIAGLILAVAGAGISVATSLLDEKKLDLKITEKVAEALNDQMGES